ncbi:hypothetical protein JHW43_008420 [Diplocarpon mali]|nr:hypothetical protein JHW43_008420 [Diplocarpon mali]
MPRRRRHLPWPAQITGIRSTEDRRRLAWSAETSGVWAAPGKGVATCCGPGMALAKSIWAKSYDVRESGIPGTRGGRGDRRRRRAVCCSPPGCSDGEAIGRSFDGGSDIPRPLDRDSEASTTRGSAPLDRDCAWGGGLSVGLVAAPLVGALSPVWHVDNVFAVPAFPLSFPFARADATERRKHAPSPARQTVAQLAISTS